MTNIKVLDAIMGSGKSTRLIDDISNLPLTTKVIVVLPLLTECHRFAGTMPAISSDGSCDYSKPEEYSIEFGGILYNPTHKLYDRFFKHPANNNENGSKLTGLESLLKNDENIVTTHALFRTLNKECLDILNEKNYLLVIDEVLTVYEEYTGFIDKKTNELPILIGNNTTYIDTDGITLRWSTDPRTRLGRYQTEIDMCDRGSLLLIDNTFLILELSKDIIQSFKEVWVATYLFNGSYFKGYLDYHTIPYSVEKFGNSAKVFKPLITIVLNPKMNEIGEHKTALSRSSQCVSKTHNDKLKKHLNNFFKQYSASPEDRLWCCFKEALVNLKGKGYTNNFLSLGTKGTNLYAGTSVLAYTANIFMNPYIVRFLRTKNITVSEESFALGEMVQWIYRSQIRNGKPITVYVPSRRMRELLIDWLNGKYD